MRSSIPASLLLAALVSLGLTPSEAHAQATLSQTLPSRAELRRWLGAYEAPEGPSLFEGRPPETVALLEEVYEDRATPFFMRLRAVAAAGHFGTARSRSFLRRVLAGEEATATQQTLMQREALVATARAFGAGALPELIPALGSPSPIVRESVANALATIGGPEATSALRAQLSRERHAGVREALERALRARPGPAGRTSNEIQ